MTGIKYSKGFFKGKDIFIGIDVHKDTWTLTAICDREVVYSNGHTATLYFAKIRQG